MEANPLVFKIVEYILEQDKATPEELASELGTTLPAVEQVCTALMQADFLFVRFGKYRFNYDHKDVAPLVKYSKKSGNRQEMQEMVLGLVTGALSPLQSLDVSIEAPEAAPMPEPPVPEPHEPEPAPKMPEKAAPREEPAEEPEEEPKAPREPEAPKEPVEKSLEEELVEETPKEPEAPKPERYKKTEQVAPEPEKEQEPAPQYSPKPELPKHIEKALKDSNRMKEEVKGMRENLEEFKQANPMLDADAKENLLGHLRLKIDNVLDQYGRESAEQLVKEFVSMQEIYLNGTSYNSAAEIDGLLPRLTDEHLMQVLEKMRHYLKRRYAAKSMKKE